MYIPIDLIILIVVIILALNGEFIAGSAVLLFREIDRNIIKPYIEGKVDYDIRKELAAKKTPVKENLIELPKERLIMPSKERFVMSQGKPTFNKPIETKDSKENYDYEESVINKVINPDIESVDDRLLKQKLVLGKKAEDSLTIRSGFQNKYQYMKYYDKELQDSSNRGGTSWWSKDELELETDHVSI